MSKKVLTPEEIEIKTIKKKYRKSKMEKVLPVVLGIAIAVSTVFVGMNMGEKHSANGDNITNDGQNSQQIEQNYDSNTGDYNTEDYGDSDNDNGSGDVANQGSNNTASNDNKNDKAESNSNTNNKDTNKNSAQKPADNTSSDKGAADDPTKWTKEQIVQFYKQSATKSHDTVESSQTMTMPKMVVNNGDGALGFFINLVTPVINNVLEKQATTYGGITGGYANLVASDVAEAKAYKEGNYTVIEMTMVEQTDGLYGDAQSGTVGHAINVLGNVATAVEQFPDFDIRYKEADIKINYANPTVKVRINENGVIEKGTWQYTAKIDIKHLKIESVMVDTAEAEIVYTIVVGEGF